MRGITESHLELHGFSGFMMIDDSGFITTIIGFTMTLYDIYTNFVCFMNFPPNISDISLDRGVRSYFPGPQRNSTDLAATEAMETLMKHDDTNATNAAAGLSISFTEKTPLVSNVNQFPSKGIISL